MEWLIDWTNAKYASLGTSKSIAMRYYHHGNPKYASLGTSKTSMDWLIDWTNAKYALHQNQWRCAILIMKMRNMLHWVHPKHRKLRRTSPKTHHMVHWVHPKRQKTPGAFWPSALPGAKDRVSMETQNTRRKRD
jgi:hypothetical protein